MSRKTAELTLILFREMVREEAEEAEEKGGKVGKEKKRKGIGKGV